MKPRQSKRQRLDEHDNEERNNLDEDENKIESARYISSPFIPLLSLLEKVSNRPLDLSERIMSLNYLVYILKICFLGSANFVLEFCPLSSTGKEAMHVRVLFFHN